LEGEAVPEGEAVLDVCAVKDGEAGEGLIPDKIAPARPLAAVVLDETAVPTAVPLGAAMVNG